MPILYHRIHNYCILASLHSSWVGFDTSWTMSATQTQLFIHCWVACQCTSTYIYLVQIVWPILSLQELWILRATENWATSKNRNCNNCNNWITTALHLSGNGVQVFRYWIPMTTSYYSNNSGLQKNLWLWVIGESQNGRQGLCVKTFNSWVLYTPSQKFMEEKWQCFLYQSEVCEPAFTKVS